MSKERLCETTDSGSRSQHVGGTLIFSSGFESYLVSIKF